MTRAESSALTGAGAPPWAGGSQKCRGKSAVLMARPRVMRAMIRLESRFASRLSPANARLPWLP